MTTTAITPVTETAIEQAEQRQQIIGVMTDAAAATGVFEDYRQRKAANTLYRQHSDLAAFTAYLIELTFYPDEPNPDQRKAYIKSQAERLQTDPAAWSKITHGVIAGFVQWQLQNGYAVPSINVRLATVRQYASLAYQAGAIDTDTHAKIRTVKGYQYKEIGRIDEKRSAAGQDTRKGTKKAEAVTLTADQIRQLKTQPDTPQGRRDALLMCILLDHGLRCGEIAALDVTSIDLERGTMTFYRPKVSKVQTHTLTNATRRAAAAYMQADAPIMGKLLRGSLKNGELSTDRMSERAITKRVNVLGERIGISGLSAHDGRHSWATRAARNNTQLDRLQDAGGWNSLAMPLRYVEAARIANSGVDLGAD